MFGVLSPFVVTELGKKGVNTEYAVRDGTRRARLLRDLNFSKYRNDHRSLNFGISCRSRFSILFDHKFFFQNLYINIFCGLIHNRS